MHNAGAHHRRNRRGTRLGQFEQKHIRIVHIMRIRAGRHHHTLCVTHSCAHAHRTQTHTRAHTHKYTFATHTQHTRTSTHDRHTHTHTRTHIHTTGDTRAPRAARTYARTRPYTQTWPQMNSYCFEQGGQSEEPRQCPLCLKAFHPDCCCKYVAHWFDDIAPELCLPAEYRIELPELFSSEGILCQVCALLTVRH